MLTLKVTLTILTPCLRPPLCIHIWWRGTCQVTRSPYLSSTIASEFRAVGEAQEAPESGLLHYASGVFEPTPAMPCLHLHHCRYLASPWPKEAPKARPRAPKASAEPTPRPLLENARRELLAEGVGRKEKEPTLRPHASKMP